VPGNGNPGAGARQIPKVVQGGTWPAPKPAMERKDTEYT